MEYSKKACILPFVLVFALFLISNVSADVYDYNAPYENVTSFALMCSNMIAGSFEVFNLPQAVQCSSAPTDITFNDGLNASDDSRVVTSGHFSGRERWMRFYFKLPNDVNSTNLEALNFSWEGIVRAVDVTIAFYNNTVGNWSILETVSSGASDQSKSYYLDVVEAIPYAEVINSTGYIHFLVYLDSSGTNGLDTDHAFLTAELIVPEPANTLVNVSTGMSLASQLDDRSDLGRVTTNNLKLTPLTSDEVVSSRGVTQTFANTPNAIANLWGFRGVTQTFSISTFTSNLQDFIRSPTQQISFAMDTLEESDLSKIIAQVLTLFEQGNAVAGLERTAEDSLSIQTGIFQLYEFIRTPDAPLQLVSTINAEFSGNRLIDLIASLFTQTTIDGEFVRNSDQIINVNLGLLRAWETITGTSDSFAFDTGMSRLFEATREPSLSILSFSSIDELLDYDRPLTDIVVMIISPERTAEFNRITTDILSVLESLVVRLDIIRFPSDNVFMIISTEDPTGAQSILVGLFENIGTTDFVTLGFDLFRNINLDISLESVGERFTELTRGIVDLFNFLISIFSGEPTGGEPETPGGGSLIGGVDNETLQDELEEARQEKKVDMMLQAAIWGIAVVLLLIVAVISDILRREKKIGAILESGIILFSGFILFLLAYLILKMMQGSKIELSLWIIFGGIAILMIFLFSVVIDINRRR